MNRWSTRAGEPGFSLVEVVVSMLVLAIVALAFFPVVLHTTRAAAGGTTLATATRLVSKHLEIVRATQLTTCPAPGPEPLGSPAGTPVTDARGVKLQAWTKFEGNCATGVARYVVSVTRTSQPTTPLATATTLIALERS